MRAIFIFSKAELVEGTSSFEVSASGGGKNCICRTKEGSVIG